MAGALAVIALLNTGGGFLVLKSLERRAGAPIHGRYIPQLVSSAFSVHRLKLGWRGEFQVTDGTVRVRYDFLSWVFRRVLRVRLKGTHLKVRFQSERLPFPTGREFQIDRIDATFNFRPKGPPEIVSFQLDSPELKFQLDPGAAGFKEA